MKNVEVITKESLLAYAKANLSEISEVIEKISETKEAVEYVEKMSDKVIAEVKKACAYEFDLYENTQYDIIGDFEELFQLYVYNNYDLEYGEKNAEDIHVFHYTQDLVDGFNLYSSISEKIKSNITDAGYKILEYDEYYDLFGRSHRVGSNIGILNKPEIQAIEIDQKIEKFWNNYQSMIEYAKMRNKFEKTRLHWREFLDLPQQTFDYNSTKNRLAYELFKHFKGEKSELSEEQITEINFIINYK